MIDSQPKAQDLSNASQALLAAFERHCIGIGAAHLRGYGRCAVRQPPVPAAGGGRFTSPALSPCWRGLRDRGRRPLVRRSFKAAVMELGEGVVTSDDDQVGDGDLSDELLQARAARLSEIMLAGLSAGGPSGSGMLPVSDTPRTATVIVRLEALLKIADRRFAIVFWIGDETMTEEGLFRHLRGINRIIIPRGPASDVFDGDRVEIEAAAAQEDAPESPNNHTGEMVVFRHADPNVMMQVFPVLDEERALRLFGPADQIFFTPDAVWGGGVKRGRRPAGGGLVGRGPLSLDRDMIEMIEDVRMQASRRKVMAYLRDVDPATANLSGHELMDRVLSYEASGTRLGLASDRAHMKWAYLMSITRGGIRDSGEARDYFQLQSKHPDDAIDDLLQELERTVGNGWDAIWHRTG